MPKKRRYSDYRKVDIQFEGRKVDVRRVRKTPIQERKEALALKRKKEDAENYRYIKLDSFETPRSVNPSGKKGGINHFYLSRI